MSGLTRTILLLSAFLVLSSENLLAWPWGPPKLVTINEQVYTSEDFTHWWASWKEADSLLPNALEEFIDWHLLAQESKTMELFRSPSYQKKIQTFLKVRAMLLLKKDTVDSKIKISETEMLYNPVNYPSTLSGIVKKTRQTYCVLKKEH